MELGSIEGPEPTCSVSARVLGLDGGPLARVRLLPIFANQIFEADVSDVGEFHVQGVECGAYTLAIIRGQSVLHSRLFRLTGETKPLTIRIETTMGKQQQ
jgi:hypothetical protein